MTAIALNAHQLSFMANLTLLRELRGSGDHFSKEIAILLENSLIPQVEKLSESGIATIMQLMEENRIDKKVYSDLLATEFARKYK